MESGPDHYAVLGLAPDATTAQIKAAYHRLAKAAHPDAGGSVEAMAKINAAYQALSDPETRRHYDDARAEHHSEAHPHRADAHPHHEPAHHSATEAAERAAAHAEAAQIHRERTAWARAHAWEMARFSAPATVAAIVAVRFIAPTLTSDAARLLVNFVSFIPVYALALSILFLINPPLRLVFADLVRHYATTKQERSTALAMILAFFPLALIWMLLF